MNNGWFFKLAPVWSALALVLIFGLSDFGNAAGKGGGGKPSQPPPSAANPVIVFKSGSDIVLADADGGNRTLVHKTIVSLNAASWCSPDGTDIVFVDEINGKTGVYRLKVIHVDASDNRTVQVEQPELIAETNDLGLTRPACSPMPLGPDQKIKVVFRDREIEPDGSLSEYDNFYLTNLDGSGAPILLLDGLQRGGLAQGSPSWSPEGDRIVFSSALWNTPGAPNDVEVVQVGWDGTGELEPICCQSLIRGVTGSPLELLDKFQPRWSNTSDQIAVAASWGNGTQIWIIDGPDHPTVATPVPYDNDAVIRADVAWSPDDSQFIYLRNPRRGMCGEGDGKKVKGTVIAKSNIGGKYDPIGVCDEVAIIKGGNGWPDLAGRFPDWWRGAPQQ